jgi:hypothetical protein
MDFLFIGAYWLEFVLISVLLSWRRSTLTKILALVAALCVTLAALFDIRENLKILSVLLVPTTPEYDRLTQAVHFAAVIKWAVLATAMLLLSLVSIGRRDRRTPEGVLFLLLGFCFFASGAIGLLGLGWHAVLEWITIPMVLGLLTLTTIPFWFPPKFS